MAHKLAHTLQSSGEDPPIDDRDRSGSTGVTRRRYVRLGGTAIATVAAVSGQVNGVAASPNDSDGFDRRIRIHGSGTPSTYEVTVGGGLVPANGANQATGHISGSTVEGAVTGDDRSYRFRGELHDVTVDGDAEVSVDGEAI